MSERVEKRFAYMPLEIARDGMLSHGAIVLLAAMASYAHPDTFNALYDIAKKPKIGWAKASGLHKGRIREYQADLERHSIIGAQPGAWFVDEGTGDWQLSWRRATLLGKRGGGSLAKRRGLRAKGRAFVRLDLVPLMRSDLPVHARRLHLVFQSYGLMGERGCYAAQATLAAASGTRVRALQKSLDALQAAGLVHVTRRRNATNHYVAV